MLGRQWLPSPDAVVLGSGVRLVDASLSVIVSVRPRRQFSSRFPLPGPIQPQNGR